MPFYTRTPLQYELVSVSNATRLAALNIPPEIVPANYVAVVEVISGQMVGVCPASEITARFTVAP